MNSRVNLAEDLSTTIAQAGVDPTLEGRAQQDAIRSAIADRRGYCSWDVDHAGWTVFLHHPDQETFYGGAMDEALAWCLVWLMFPKIGIGQFLMRAFHVVRDVDVVPCLATMVLSPLYPRVACCERLHYLCSVWRRSCV